MLLNILCFLLYLCHKITENSLHHLGRDSYWSAPTHITFGQCLAWFSSIWWRHGSVKWMNKYTENQNSCVYGYFLLHVSASFGHHQVYLNTKIKHTKIKYNEVWRNPKYTRVVTERTFIHFSFIFHRGMHKTVLTWTGTDVSKLRNVIAVKRQTEMKRVYPNV